MFAAQSIDEARRFADMAESLAGVGYWRMCAKTSAISWSPNMYRIFGFDPTQPPLLADALARIHPDDREGLESRLEAYPASGTVSSCSRIMLPNGELRYIESKQDVERREDGTIIHHYGTVADITDQLRSQRELAASEARWRLVAENASDIVAFYGPDSVLTYVSPAVERILGISPASLIGRSAYEVIAVEDHAFVRGAFRKLFAGGGVTEASKIEYRACRSDGREIWLEAYPRLIFNEAGYVVEIQDVVRDVSARKEIETALLAAKEEAESAARLKGEFVANVTHELRTPLTSIIGYAKLMQDPNLDHKMLGRYVNNIVSAGESLLVTINDVLDFSSLESGTISVCRTPQSISALVSEVARLFEAPASNAGIELICGVLDSVPEVLFIDAIRVKQLLMNFVGNAMKFTTHGNVCIEARFDAARSVLRMTVSDTGCGVSDEAKGLLFKRFSQVDGSSTRTRSGTGLGLAIAKGLVESMGGQIGMNSQVGVGSQFWFTLPASTYEEVTVSPLPSNYDFIGLRVLVVDDHPAIAQLVAALLSREGVAVEIAMSGQAGLEAAQESPFDAVFIDLNMPDFGGIELAGRIRQQSGFNQHVPLAAITAAGGSQLEVARQVFDAVVSKPLVSESLFSTLAALTADRGHFLGNQLFSG